MSGEIEFDIPTIHVIPKGDVITHLRVDDECPCRPVRHQEGGTVLWIHRAVDGREEFELEG